MRSVIIIFKQLSQVPKYQLLDNILSLTITSVSLLYIVNKTYPVLMESVIIMFKQLSQGPKDQLLNTILSLN